MHTICGLNYFEYHMLYTFCYKALGQGLDTIQTLNLMDTFDYLRVKLLYNSEKENGTLKIYSW